ncbi:MAG TPA: MBL fold metallo-hydrolase [Hellea balneolensis]|uniref:MBL fold metallo-hydrolase n=1 Tax=Hellea balneolensis TaxID=287478 RepID=A0A7V5U0W0_9PROT|nr:MBL fold metallo-hydrolase [Hellea balneolensis]
MKPFATGLGTLLLASTLWACQAKPDLDEKIISGTCTDTLYVLGTAQDGGKPQIGHPEDAAWTDPTQIRAVSSVAVVDKPSGSYLLFDATPDIKFELYALGKYSGLDDLKLEGVFLTHGHIGHYLGLAQFGREAMGAKGVPVYAMAKMRAFLEQNGPWDQLIELDNIALQPLEDKKPVRLRGVEVTPFVVPHRGEYTETVGFRIKGKGKTAVYLPDIDSWEQWQKSGGSLIDLITNNDYVFIDGTFYDGDELPGRDMSKIPHPTMVHTMTLLKPLSPAARGKVHFIHLNHTNPANDKNTRAWQDIDLGGFKIARAGARFCLD